MSNKYGPQTYQIEKMLERIKTLSPDEVTGLQMARSAARSAAWHTDGHVAWDATWLRAWHAARHTSEQAAWDATWPRAQQHTHENFFEEWQTARNASWLRAWHASRFHARRAAQRAAQVEAWDEAWDETWRAVWFEAWDETWPADWLEAQQAAQDAVSAVSARHLIGPNGFTLEHYNIQTKPWREVIGEFE